MFISDREKELIFLQLKELNRSINFLHELIDSNYNRIAENKREYVFRTDSLRVKDKLERG